MNGLIIVIITLVIQSVEAGKNLKVEEYSEESIPSMYLSLVNLTLGITNQEMRPAPSGRRTEQCASSGCNYWEKVKLSTKLFFYFLRCETSNFGDREKADLCLIDKIYGPNSKMKEECMPCVCEVACSRKPSYCDECQCGQDIFIPAPSVVPCLTNVTEYSDKVSRTLCALRNYKTQANTNSLPASCVETSGLLSCDVICDTFISGHINMTDLVPTECLSRKKCKHIQQVRP